MYSEEQRAFTAIADAFVAMQLLALAINRQNVDHQARRTNDWSDADLVLLYEIYPRFTNKELSVLFGRTHRAVKSAVTKRKWRLHKQRETTARALRDVEHIRQRTQFKKGHRPSTWVPIGTEVIDAYGYRKRKVRDGMVPAVYNFEFCHVLLWEEHHGRVPDGHKVSFANGNKTDIRIENLECISDAEMMRRNTFHQYPEPIRRMIHAKKALTRKINTRIKTNEKHQ